MEHRTILDASDAPELSRLQPAGYIVIDIGLIPGSRELLDALEMLVLLSTMVRADDRGDRDGGDELSPLEGVWNVPNAEDAGAFEEGITGKIMMRQPRSLTAAGLEEVKRTFSQTRGLGEPLYLEAARFVVVDEGLCVQIRHIGPYSDEPRSFALIDHHLQQHHMRRTTVRTHREIYLVDSRTAEPEAYETVLRAQVESE